MNRRNILHKYWLLFWHVAMLSLLCAPLRAQQPINTLTFKATHNSYACCGGGNDCPVMHNSPPEQIDDWGVWALELDFSIKLENGIPRLIVGHNDDDDTWTNPSWGKYLDEFLIDIRNARSLSYRPIFIFFGKKDRWGNKTLPWVPLLDSLLCKTFGCDNIFGPAALKAFLINHTTWPTVPELAHKIIPVAIEDRAEGSDLVFHSEPTGISRVGPFDTYIDSLKIANLAGPGKILATDQYQENWTFALSSPPNPLYVEKGLLPFFFARNTIGRSCAGCSQDPTDIECLFVVDQQGTFRFPFRTVFRAANRALPGWTVLIKAGNYSEAFVIDKPLTLKADGGTVTIGR